MYFGSGEEFERLIQELSNAQYYIFLEYFIIQHGIMWDTILDILHQKKKGIDVRVLYDDVGCVATLPYGYAEKLTRGNPMCCI